MSGVEWWVVRIVVERRGARLVDPVSGEHASPEQTKVIHGRIESEVYVVVPGIGICEPLESVANEDTARDRMTTLAAKHDRERFALVMAVGL